MGGEGRGHVPKLGEVGREEGPHPRQPGAVGKGTSDITAPPPSGLGTPGTVSTLKIFEAITNE